MEALEESAIDIGHEIIAKSLSLALESFDAQLCSSLPEGTEVHEKGGAR